MPWTAAVEDENGQTLAKLVIQHHHYVLDDGRTVSMETCVAWCRKCRRFTVAEDLKTPAALDRQLEAATRQYTQLRSEPLAPAGAVSPQQQAEMVRRVVESVRQRYELLKEIFERREGPARCLTCGGSDFTRIERDTVQWVEDPRGGGRLRVQITARAHPVTEAGRYSVEGLRLP